MCPQSPAGHSAQDITGGFQKMTVQVHWLFKNSIFSFMFVGNYIKESLGHTK